MGMTNEQIIFNEQMRLLKEGLILPTGRTITVQTDMGEVTVPEAEPIHTFQRWKELGFSVKKGEHAVTRLTIWKYTGKRKDDEKNQEAESGHCFLKQSCFFSEHQVEALA